MKIHHIALRVLDVAASKAWFVNKLDLRVETEFEVNGLDFVWLTSAESRTPILELIGGGPQRPRGSYEIENPFEFLKQPSFNHVCLQFDDLDFIVAELKRRDVKILVDVTPGPTDVGIEKVAFIADPWDNAIELLQLRKA